jgi:hypothetical protein
VTGFRAFLQSPTSLRDSLEPLVAAFNAARDRPRVLAILSPDGDSQRAQEALRSHGSEPATELIVVWAAPAAGALASSRSIAPVRARQFWDPSRRAIEAFREEPDAYLFFDRDARWSAQPPKPARVVRR